MVKLQDGSLVMASALFSGEAEDHEGNKLKFEPSDNNNSGLVPMLKAQCDTSDGKTKLYTVDFGNTLVKVSVSTIEQKEEEEGEDDKETGEQSTDTSEGIKLITEPPPTTTTITTPAPRPASK